MYTIDWELYTTINLITTLFSLIKYLNNCDYILFLAYMYFNNYVFIINMNKQLILHATEIQVIE